MNLLLLGIVVGTLTLIPPGPINLTLLHLGARHGRTYALQGAVGVMGGDSVLAVVALAMLSMGAVMPASVFSTVQLVSAGLLGVIGMTLALKPAAVSGSLDRIQRPTRAFFLLTSLTPTALGSWVALLAAMPFAGDARQLGVFAAGVLIASYCFHPALGIASASIGSRLDARGQTWLARGGGLAMAAVGVALGVSKLA